MDRADVQTWVDGYERLWRTPGSDLLGELFTPLASYRTSPWSLPLQGLPAIARLWEAERAGPDEEFTLSGEVVALDGRTAVVRVEVRYGDGAGESWRDLWVLEFAEDGRCTSFEEWPFAPEQDDGH